MPKRPGYVLGTVRAGAELSHPPQVSFFYSRKTLQPDPEKSLIETGDSQSGSGFNVGDGYGRSLGDIPKPLAPFLEKVRVASGLSQYGVQRSAFNLYSFRLGWFGNRLPGVCKGQRPDLWEIK